MNNHEEPIDAEVVSTQLATAQQLPADLMLLKLENESIMAVASAKPRDPGEIVKKLQALVDAYPASADEAIYIKPVGTVTKVTCGTCKAVEELSWVPSDWSCAKCESGKISERKKIKKFAEGLSIRAAESIRSIFGFTRLSVTVESLAGGAVKIRGVMVDYSAGNITADERIVSPNYTKRGGGVGRVPEDRFLNVIVKAEKAKLRRDVILDSTPNYIKAYFQNACEEKLKSLLDSDAVKKKVLPWFEQQGVSQEQVEDIVGKKLAMGWTQQDVLHLKKIKTAVESGETTIRELIDPADGAADAVKPASKVEEKLAQAAAKKAAAEAKRKTEAAAQNDAELPDTLKAGADADRDAPLAAGEGELSPAQLDVMRQDMADDLKSRIDAAASIKEMEAIGADIMRNAEFLGTQHAAALTYYQQRYVQLSPPAKSRSRSKSEGS
jgi:hypothetical protein